MILNQNPLAPCQLHNGQEGKNLRIDGLIFHERKQSLPEFHLHHLLQKHMYSPLPDCIESF